MSAQTTDTVRGKAATDASPSGRARPRRLITALTVLAFLAIGAVALYAISLIIDAVVLLLLSALLAYIISPLVQFLQRRLTRAPAIVIAYLLVASAFAVVMVIVVSALIQQSSSLAQSIQFLLSPAGERRTQAIIDVLGKVGITTDQVAQIKNQLLSQAQGILSGTLPFLTGLLGNIITLIVVVTLSVYFVVDGPRILGWLHLKTPATQGAYVIGVLCILAALPQGWVVTLVVAVYLTLLQGVVIGQILSPRIFSTTVGIHPIVALFALFAGAELFGLLGGLLAVPVAGVLQQILVALWHRWKQEHPEQFPPEEPPLQPSAQLPEQQVLPFRAAERSEDAVRFRSEREIAPTYTPAPVLKP